jgi:tricorn protease
MDHGYYRFPTIYRDTVVFVSEDDLWLVPRQGGLARRLTSNLGEVNYPALSPDGSWLAFVGREEGMPEIYLMPAVGGSAQRLTYLNSRCQVLGWNTAGTHILFATNSGPFHPQEYTICAAAIQTPGSAATPLPVGPARSIAYGPNGGAVIGRNTGDPARWKRYRGGTAGHFWIDRTGDGQFQRFLSELPGNLASPLWLPGTGDGRIYFISDHEGIGNLYSVNPAGEELQRHTDHSDFYARNPQSDGQRIVYHAGADLYVYDPATATTDRVAVEYHSPRVQRNRKFSPANAYLDSARLTPRGDALAVTTRGKAFSFFNHAGPVVQIGQRDGVRYRLPEFLNDDNYLVVVDDSAGEEELVIFSSNFNEPPRRLSGLDIGRPVTLKVSPTEDTVALTNHRQELLVVDLQNGQLTRVDRSEWRPITGVDWSHDGRWLAYGFGVGLNTTEIRLYQLPDPAATSPTSPRHPNPIAVTRPLLHDVAPSFDPDGNYLYFLSFPWGMRPYLLLLRADLPNPFLPQPGEESEDEAAEDGGREVAQPDEPEDGGENGEENGDEEGEEHAEEDEAAGGHPALQQPPPTRKADQEAGPPTGNARTDSGRASNSPTPPSPQKPSPPRPLVIDLDGIQRRILAFPLPDSRYGQIAGAPGRVLLSSYSLRGALDTETEWVDEPEEGGSLRAWIFKEYRSELIAEGVSRFELSRNRKKLLYFDDGRLRVISALEKAPNPNGPGRRSGWIDLSRIQVSILPPSEWEQMYREAWRLQRDHFWTEDMAEVDWQMVYERYHPLLERVSSRSEFSDLVWEMQGELGTSHAYELGGDYRPAPYYSQGVLGADFVWDESAGGYRIENIVEGDAWNPQATSPLAVPGIDIQPGDLLLAVNGQQLSASLGPAQLLVNQADQEILLTLAQRLVPKASSESVPALPTADIAPEGGEGGAQHPAAEARSVVVKAIQSDDGARYRAWVEKNRQRVHAATEGRIGYVHIPDMGSHGYAEFHRGFLSEVMRDGLIVDVRYNDGGNVSQLLLEKLARRRIGYDATRWSRLAPYPADSVGGPVVALTNELAGSDGDIFCHAFKLLQLGPLVGKRTWGGVIGIQPSHPLVDGTITTQPEYSTWFEDVGWMVENYGTEPDIDVDITPQEYLNGQDTQLERAVAEALKLLAATQPVARPDRSTRPSRALPRLPGREPPPRPE